MNDLHWFWGYKHIIDIKFYAQDEYMHVFKYHSPFYLLFLIVSTVRGNWEKECWRIGKIEETAGRFGRKVSRGKCSLYFLCILVVFELVCEK